MKKNTANIIILALFYKYLSTGKNELNVWDIDKYRISIDYTFYDAHHSYPITWEETDIPEVYYHDECYNYHFVEPINLDSICKRFIDYLPQEVLIESLKEEHLRHIGANRNKIKTNVITERKRDTLNIYSMSDKDAKASALKCLTQEGAKNIEIGSAFYLGMQSDHLWRVYVTYEKDLIYIDFPGILKYSSRRIGNQFIEYREEEPDNVLHVEFNDDNLTPDEIDKTTTKVRAFIYNPITDAAIIVHYAGLYMLPGGKVDYFETNREALIREIKEETGIQIKPEEITPYLVINSYDKNYYDRKDGTINRHTKTTFYKIITTASIDDRKKQLTESEIAKKHKVAYVPLHNMKNIVESNDTTNSKRKQFDREILLAINEFLNTLGINEEEHKLLHKMN